MDEYPTERHGRTFYLIHRHRNAKVHEFTYLEHSFWQSKSHIHRLWEVKLRSKVIRKVRAKEIVCGRFGDIRVQFGVLMMLRLGQYPNIALLLHYMKVLRSFIRNCPWPKPKWFGIIFSWILHTIDLCTYRHAIWSHFMYLYTVMHNRMEKRSRRSQNTWLPPTLPVRACSIHSEHVPSTTPSPVVAEIYMTDLCYEDGAEARVRCCVLAFLVAFHSPSQSCSRSARTR